ncbi:MAG: MMPL family transporter [Candidatus Thermoplasmatota archaeon]
MLDLDHLIGNAVSKIFTWSARRAKVVLAFYLVVTLVFAYGLTGIQVRSTDYDLMPDDHPSATANYRALTELPGFRNADTLWIEVSQAAQKCDQSGQGCTVCDPNALDASGERDPNCHRDNITSERSIRAAEEATKFIQEKMTDPVTGKAQMPYVITLPYLVKLINYTASGVPNPSCSIGAIPAAPPGGIPIDQCKPLKEPDASAFALPDDSAMFARDYQVLFAAAQDVVQAQTNENFTGAILVFIYDLNITKEGPEKVVPVATKFVHAAQEWRDVGCPALQQKNILGNGPAFNCDHTYILGQSINGHMTELAQSDFQTWGPIVFIVTFLVLVVAFTDVPSMLIAFVSFCMGLVWTYGLMGYLHIPLTFFGLLIVPITMGVGKEYAIYVTNQYMEYSASDRSKEVVWAMVGRRAGAALAIASITSVAGLLAMFLAGFHIMRDLALLTVFSFSALFLLSITFIPAAQSVRKTKAKVKPFKPSILMGGVCKAITKNRVATIAFVVIVTGALAYESTKIEEYFGISGGFKDGDYVEESYRFYNQALGGSGTELVVFESKEPGGIADPATLKYIASLDQSFLRDSKHVPKSSNIASLMLGLRTYYDLKAGLYNPAIAYEKQPGADPYVNIPMDKARVAADIKYMYTNPIWSPLVAIFVSPDSNFAVTHVFYKIGNEDYASLKDDWNNLNCDVGNTPTGYACANAPTMQRPSTLRSVDLVGTQDTFYLFVEYGMPWLDYVGYIATFLTLIIAIAVLGRPEQFLGLLPGGAVAFAAVSGYITHAQLPLYVGGAAVLSIAILVFLKARDTLAVMIPMIIASVWWLGALPLFDIKASMTLMLPTVMLISVGSDYAIQYVWNYREVGSMEEVYRTTGKANLYVVIATVVAFLLFVPMKLVLSSQGALAAALAIVSIFLSTTILVPLFYPPPEASAVVVAREVQSEAQTVVPVAR